MPDLKKMGKSLGQEMHPVVQYHLDKLHPYHAKKSIRKMVNFKAMMMMSCSVLNLPTSTRKTSHLKNTCQIGWDQELQGRTLPRHLLLPPLQLLLFLLYKRTSKIKVIITKQWKKWRNQIKLHILNLLNIEEIKLILNCCLYYSSEQDI